ncbi:MAG TPA: sigma-70 family RNA polymerase sigma factor [Caulobacteraceae bacterium]
MTNLARTFEAERGALVGLAYRLTGSRADAEDVAQDAWLRWRKVDTETVEDPHAYLATVVTRLCLDRMKSARARREIYVGPWLPEPIVDETLGAGPGGELAEDLSMALMLALERLSPLERAAFILHDVFDLGFAEVARGLGRSEEACRRLAARAREHVREDRPRYPVAPEDGRRVIEAFQRASELGDVKAISALLTEDAVFLSDGGGRRVAALRPIEGASDIASFIEGIATRRGAFLGLEVRPATVNGLPGLVARSPEGELDAMGFEFEGGKIRAIYVVRNPEKLSHVRF